MLVQLTIQNLVLIERLTLELSPGFNVITGETGAGKSMLVDALGLVIGGRASPELVRKGAREAEVEALFDVAPGSRVAARLEAAGIPCDRELVLRRVVQAEGRSRAFANGRMCTLSQLADLAGDLCDIASQHESVALTDPATHLDTLDAFGGLESARLELGQRSTSWRRSASSSRRSGRPTGGERSGRTSWRSSCASSRSSTSSPGRRRSSSTSGRASVTPASCRRRPGGRPTGSTTARGPSATPWGGSRRS